MWKQIGVAIIASWLPISGFATEPASNMDPEIKGSLDGEPREWFILSHGNDSNASFVELGDDINIEITGFTDNESWESQEALLISLIVG
ncbi:MAG TPA: hypothetical protein VLO13_00220 [Halomonas sp.]|nr:hypothetical protein [Halomonas sp.]